MTTRRQILKGLAATAAALILPPKLTENAEAVRRFWALDGTMLGKDSYTYEWRWDGPRPTHLTFGPAIAATDEFVETMNSIPDYEGLAYVMSSLFGAPMVTRVEGAVLR